MDATVLVGGQYDIDKVMEQAKKLGIDWKAYTLIKSSQNYPTLQKSINLVYGLTDKLFLGSLIFSAIILVLVLFLWTNSRRREIGVRLALGMTNKTIIAQMLCEVGMVSIASFIAAILAGGPVSEWVGKLILGQVNSSLGTQLANEAKSANLGGGAAVDGFNKTLTELSVTVSNMDKATVVGLGLVVVVIAVLLGSAFILQKSPKSLLQDTE
ncbi:MAG: ABC transporter permease [Candidatus Granulicatella sp. P6S_S16_bin.50.1]|nr:ABC transporter permease [Candidatus Granulicatella sp. P6S_S16_bin.50.1]